MQALSLCFSHCLSLGKPALFLSPFTCGCFPFVSLVPFLPLCGECQLVGVGILSFKESNFMVNNTIVRCVPWFVSVEDETVRENDARIMCVVRGGHLHVHTLSKEVTIRISPPRRGECYVTSHSPSNRLRSSAALSMIVGKYVQSKFKGRVLSHMQTMSAFRWSDLGFFNTPTANNQERTSTNE